MLDALLGLVNPPKRLPQRAIYDARYAGDGYDTRSGVRVLGAEWRALQVSFDRARDTFRDRCLTWLDYGYGTGRVTNDFLLHLAHARLRRKVPADGIHLIALDVSRVGLRKGHDELVSGLTRLGLDPRPVPGTDWDRADDDRTVVLGDVTCARRPIRVSYVHAHEDTRDLTAQEVSGLTGDEGLHLTTSWYSFLATSPPRPSGPRTSSICTP